MRAIQPAHAFSQIARRRAFAPQSGSPKDLPLAAVQPGFGNRNLFFDWKNRATKESKVTRSNGKYYGHSRSRR